jgi:hypothetical protein
MAKYGCHNLQAGSQQNLSSTAKTIVAGFVVTGSLRRGALFAVEFGADGAPNATDCALDWELLRFTADGTGTAATPSPEDSADVACLTNAKVNYTAEPTYGVSMRAWGVNQRGTWKWLAWSESDRLVWPAVDHAGLGLRAKSPTYASTVVASFAFDEL